MLLYSIFDLSHLPIFITIRQTGALKFPSMDLLSGRVEKQPALNEAGRIFEFIWAPFKKGQMNDQ